MTDETNTEDPGSMVLQDFLAMLQGAVDPEVRERLAAGQPPVEITAALAYKLAPNDKCREFFNVCGCHELEVVKSNGADLYQNGPTITLAESTKNREFVNCVLTFPGMKPVHTATFTQIAEDLGDYVDAAVRRQATSGDAEALNRSAVQDITSGLSILLRGLRNLTNNDELVDLRDNALESGPEAAS